MNQLEQTKQPFAHCIWCNGSGHRTKHAFGFIVIQKSQLETQMNCICIGMDTTKLIQLQRKLVVDQIKTNKDIFCNYN